MVFKDDKRPIYMHRGLWDDLEPFEERDLMSESEAVEQVKDQLQRSRNSKTFFDISDVRLAYFATEYAGGPDLLEPYYFAELMYESPKGEMDGEMTGPRRVMHFPAYR